MGSKAENLAGKMFYALIAVAAGMFGIFIVSVPIVEVIKVAVDDMGYYMKISENMALGLGPTFDGLHLTNGYHPLWFLIPLIICESLFFCPRGMKLYPKAHPNE